MPDIRRNPVPAPTASHQAVRRLIADVQHNAAATSAQNKAPKKVVSAAAPAVVQTVAPPKSVAVPLPATAKKAASAKKPEIIPAKPKPALPRQDRSKVLRRHIVARANQYQEQAKVQRRRTIVAFGLGGLMASLLFGGLLLFTVMHRRPDANKPIVPATLAARTDVAQEVPVTSSQLAAYTVEPDAPRIIRIPKLSVMARIYPVGLAFNGEPVPASNIFDVGWLKSGVKPGETGAALINGHTSGTAKAGVFANVSTLAVGDVIIVERGDGKAMKFKVTGAKTYEADAVDMAAAVRPAIAGKPGLNLLTNTGKFNVRTNKFEQRTLVTAVLQ